MADYLFEPIETDPDVILKEFIDYIQNLYPNWEPSEGQLDVLIARFFALKTAIVADMASRVMRGIYIYFGSTIVKIQPVTAREAEADTTWVALDTLGHTIFADTLVGIHDSLGDLQVFSTIVDTVIPPGSSTASNVVIRAQQAGVQGNGLTGTVELVEQLDWLLSATSNVSSGGADAETETDYLNRLTANLGLMSPRPILAPDFALISRNVTGVWRASALDNFLPGTNKAVTLTHNHTGGSFTISFGGDISGSLNWNATPAQINAALLAMPSVEPGDVTATGGPLPALTTFTFGSRYAYSSSPTISFNSSLTGGSSVTTNTTVAGSAANFVAENAIAVAALDTNGNAIGTTVKTDLDAYLQSLRQQNFIINVIDPAITSVDVTFTAVKVSGAIALDVETRAEQALTDYLDSRTWGVPIWPPDGRGWERKTALRGQELYTVLNNVPGLDYVSVLNFSAGAGAAQTGADKTLLGIFPIARPGVIAGTVT